MITKPQDRVFIVTPTQADFDKAIAHLKKHNFMVEIPVSKKWEFYKTQTALNISCETVGIADFPHYEGENFVGKTVNDLIGGENPPGPVAPAIKDLVLPEPPYIFVAQNKEEWDIHANKLKENGYKPEFGNEEWWNFSSYSPCMRVEPNKTFNKGGKECYSIKDGMDKVKYNGREYTVITKSKKEVYIIPEKFQVGPISTVEQYVKIYDAAKKRGLPTQSSSIGPDSPYFPFEKCVGNYPYIHISQGFHGNCEPIPNVKLFSFEEAISMMGETGISAPPQKQLKLKEGQLVKICDKPPEDKLKGLWVDGMDSSCGKTGKIQRINHGQYCVNGYYYDESWLTPVESPIPPKTWCECSRDEWKILLTELEQNDYKWCSGYKPTEGINWSHTWLGFGEGGKNDLRWSQEMTIFGYKKITFAQAMELLGKPQKEKEKTLVTLASGGATPTPPEEKEKPAEIKTKTFKKGNKGAVICRNEEQLSQARKRMESLGLACAVTYEKPFEKGFVCLYLDHQGWDREKDARRSVGDNAMFTYEEFMAVTAKLPAIAKATTPALPSKALNIGDEVRIINKRPQEGFATNNGHRESWISPDMDKLCGKIVTISHIDEYGFLAFKDVSWWHWHPDWVEAVAPKSPEQKIVDEMPESVECAEIVPDVIVETKSESVNLNLRPTKELRMFSLFGPTQLYRYGKFTLKATLLTVAIYVIGFLVSFGKQQYDVVKEAAQWPVPVTNFAVETSNEVSQNALEVAGETDWMTVGMFSAAILSLIGGGYTTYRGIKRNRVRDEQMAELLKLVKKA